MQAVGFVLFVIGIMLVFAAKRIVLAKVKLEKQDQEEMEMLAQGGVIAVKVAGFIVALVGILFLIIR
ncbi:hypothetical protein PBV87_04060 [Niameybacter massiliensis]|uniref:Uncharacterized protein n=1 Tax=Holtiella tumoricola TaxID=3018743 RepID=A0AA42DKM6_9FIRM|nr:hypothetical protein [Holtiella tumoricola]MDA3730673.1 hypothetical protein [Holtiella tumoricola]